jgi:tripartite-type tricarboxylate transporter receptor subunit TctC
MRTQEERPGEPLSFGRRLGSLTKPSALARRASRSRRHTGANPLSVKTSVSSSTRAIALALLGGLCALLTCNLALATEPAYPVKPVRMLVGVPPGSGADTVSRAVGLQLSQQLGRSVVVDNRPGAGGAMAMEVVIRAPADGYTLLSASVGLVATARLLKKVSADPTILFEPIIEMTAQPYVVLVSPSAPYRSIPELISHARAHPGTINYASSGTGSASHLGTELFKSMANVNLTRIAYKGLGQALNELVAGQVHVLFSTFVSATPYIKSGRVRPIAVTRLQRLSSYPELPTVAESGVPGFELSSAYALYAPAKTPQAILARVNREVAALLETAEVRARLAADGAEVAERNTPASFKASFAREVVRWETLAKASAVMRDELLGNP